jgi:hypothetical protein
LLASPITGLVQLGRKIALSKNINKLTLKKNDLVKIGEYKYIVYKFRRGQVELIPIDNLLDSEDQVNFVPKITIGKQHLMNHSKLDNLILFYLLNQQNPLIREVVEDFLENKRV